MAKLTLCSDGYDISDQVFTIEIDGFNEISVFIELVKNGGVPSGLIKPAVIIESEGKEQTVSHRNDWQIDEAQL